MDEASALLDENGKAEDRVSGQFYTVESVTDDRRIDIEDDQRNNISEVRNESSTIDTESKEANLLNKTNIKINEPVNIRLSYIVLNSFIAIFAYGTWLYSTALTQYVYDYFQKDLFPNSTYLDVNAHGSVCNVNKTSKIYLQRTKMQQETAKWTILNSVSEKIPGIIASYVIGTFSDRYGRKKLLNVTIAGEFIKSLLYFLFALFDINAYYFLLATCIQGLSGGVLGVASVSFAYVADIADSNKERTFMITILQMSLGIGATISDFTSGYIIEKLGYVYCIAVASGFIALSLVVINVCLKDPQRQVSQPRVSLSENLTYVFKFYTQDTSSTAKRWKYTLCIFIFMLACFAYLSRSGIDTLYLLNMPFCWSSVKLGWFFTIQNLVNNCIGMGSIKLFQKFTNFSEGIIAIISSLSNALSCILEALSYSDVMMFLVPVVGALSSLAMPMMRGIMSKMSPPDKQGALFSSMACVETLCYLINDVSTKSVYIATVAVYRGFVYFLYCGYNVIVVLLLALFINGSKEYLTHEVSHVLN